MKKVWGHVCLFMCAIVGGPLVAPLPSEASQLSLTLSVDGTTPPVSILSTTNTSSTCTAAEVTLGYNFCYAIKTGSTYTGSNGRQYTIQNILGSTARLRVADKNGQDKMSLIGVKFVPVSPTTWSNSESHTLKITMSNIFDATTDPVTGAAINVNNAGLYKWSLRTGGSFTAGGPAGSNAINDSVTLTGKGTFSASLVNKDILSPGTGANSRSLSFTVAGPSGSPLSYDGTTNPTMGQVDPTYPTFNCASASDTTKCKPTITVTMTAMLVGADTFNVVNGQDAFAALCTETLSDKQQAILKFLGGLVKVLDFFENRHPNPKLQAVIDRINAFLASIGNPDPSCPGTALVQLDNAVAAAIDAQAFIAEGAVPATPGTGTIVIRKTMSDQEPSVQTFGFSGTGFGILPTFTITTDDENCDGLCGRGSTAFSGLTTGALGGSREIKETGLPENWRLDSVDCVGANEESGTDWQRIYDDGEGPLIGVRANSLSDNDTLTCTFDNIFNNDDGEGGEGGGGGVIF